MSMSIVGIKNNTTCINFLSVREQPQSKLAVEALTTSFLRPVNLHIGRGACLALHGPSGAGKTLLLRAIADLDVNEGEVWLDGVPRHRFTPPEWRRRVAYLPTDTHWWAGRVGEHAALWPEELLSQLGFDSRVLGWEVERLSSGERQRLALARMLANQPAVLLLDEPTANLDSANAHNVEQLILGYLASKQAAAIWVTHDPDQRRRVAHSSARMARGVLTMEGP